MKTDVVVFGLTFLYFLPAMLITIRLKESRHASIDSKLQNTG